MSSTTQDNNHNKWTNIAPQSWIDAISQPGSTFYELYAQTKQLIERQIQEGKHDIVIEVGCGTGDVLANLKTSLPRVGVDINPAFIETCKQKFPTIAWDTVDATELMAWWNSASCNTGNYSNPLIICCNNTMNIMPHSIRYRVISQMRSLCGPKGKIFISYFNGQYFSHGIANFYRKNPQLCGNVNVSTDIDWSNQSLVVSETGYHTQWLKPEELLRLMESYDTHLTWTPDLTQEDCLFVKDIGLFVVFGSSTSGLRDFFDSDDAQKFYMHVWGENTIHIGRYDNLTILSYDPSILAKQVVDAQEYHEKELCRVINSKMQFTTDGRVVSSRFLDMGCGFGGLLRRLVKQGCVRSAVAVDISYQMCEATRRLNEQAGFSDIIHVCNESYFNLSAPNESTDYVISVDAAFLANSRVNEVFSEAYRVLRPGGWMILTDVVQRTASVEGMEEIYKALKVKTLGTVESYEQLTKNIGFESFSFTSHAANLALHHGAVNAVLQDLRNNPNPAVRLELSPQFLAAMGKNLSLLTSHDAANLDWGTFVFQKVN